MATCLTVSCFFFFFGSLLYNMYRDAYLLVWNEQWPGKAIQLQDARQSPFFILKEPPWWCLICLPSFRGWKISWTLKADDNESYRVVTGWSARCILIRRLLPRCTLMTWLVRVRLGEWFITQSAESGWWACYSRMCEAGCLAEIDITTDVKPTALQQMKKKWDLWKVHLFSV